MSPEQALGRPADARSDIFSFGLVPYEMITGTRAFDGPDASGVMAAIIERQAIDRVLQKCLAKDPDDRWQSARDLRTALEWSAETAVPPHSPRFAWLRWVASLAAAGAIGAALARPAPVADAPLRALSLEIQPPPGSELDMSVLGGGSAISRDGAHVAFVARAAGVSKLWVRSLASVTWRELPDTEGAHLPFWSPDGRALGYFATAIFDGSRWQVAPRRPSRLSRALVEARGSPTTRSSSRNR